MRLIRETNNPNLTVGIFLLILLAVFAGPNMFPRFISSIVPGIDEAMPCAWLRHASERDRHQSLIGRGAENPLSLSVRAGPLPADPSGVLVITITIVNNSLGTVAFVFNENQVIVGDNGTTGVGLIFSPPNSLQSGFRQNDPVSFPENDIKLLAPRQRCIHRVEFPAGNVLIDPALTSGSAQVRAFYRGNAPGQVIQPANALATPIYPDQGLPVGFIQSEPVLIPPRSG